MHVSQVPAALLRHVVLSLWWKEDDDGRRQEQEQEQEQEALQCERFQDSEEGARA